jgi:hypothetical protein
MTHMAGIAGVDALLPKLSSLLFFLFYDPVLDLSLCIKRNRFLSGSLE